MIYDYVWVNIPTYVWFTPLPLYDVIYVIILYITQEMSINSTLAFRMLM